MRVKERDAEATVKLASIRNKCNVETYVWTTSKCENNTQPAGETREGREREREREIQTHMPCIKEEFDDWLIRCTGSHHHNESAGHGSLEVFGWRDIT